MPPAERKALTLPATLMTFSLRHIILLIGIVTIIFSFLFFGRDTGTYDILITAGLIISTASFLFVLFKKDTVKSKILWALVVIASVGLQWLTEPIFVKTSYSIFIKSNTSRLTQLNAIVMTKQNEFLFIPSSEKIISKDFTETEVKEIQSLISGTNISLIQKDSQKLFYRTFGMLDVSHGVYYFYDSAKPDKSYKHISGNWYY